MTIKVLLISLPQSTLSPEFFSVIAIILPFTKNGGHEKRTEGEGAGNITNIKFVCRAIEIADFTAHFGWMRFQSF